MDGLLATLAVHWFDLVQTAGIVASLVFAAVALSADRKKTVVQVLFLVTEQYRSIWTQMYTDPGLGRVLITEADLKENPVTPDEDLFVRLLAFHLQAVLLAAEFDMYSLPDAIESEVGAFFRRPIPYAVWQRIRSAQNRKFAEFVDRTLARPS